MRSVPPNDPLPRPPLVIAEVKYSLHHILQELKAERSASPFAMEQLDQTEREKLLKAKPAPRVKPHL